MPITVEQFREILRNQTDEHIVEEVLLSGDAVHVSADDLEVASQALLAAFNLQPSDIRLQVVGTAKLGFSLIRKRLPDGTRRRLYHRFAALSDIDIAVISPRLFELIWHELSIFAHTQEPFPWTSKLGHYMVYGWLRPDHFPKDANLRLCDGWWEQFDRLSANAARFGRHKVRGALYYDRSFLVRYQLRGIRQCRAEEQLAQ